MKKYIVSFLIINFIFFVDCISIGAVSRTALEDYVVSTALSYLHNNIYTDYDQYAMDASSQMTIANNKTVKNTSFNWRRTNVSPEQISRTNIFSIDCSSFASIVYKYSLGYDFSEHYKAALNNTYYTYDYKNSVFVRKYVKKPEDVVKRLELTGRGYNVRYYIAASALEYGVSSEKKSGSTASSTQDIITENIVPGKYYIDNSNTKMGVFIYRVKNSNLNKMTDELKEAYRKMESILRPGDSINFLREDASGNVTGHTMVYVGTVLGEKGLIHSTGNDYYTKDGVLNSISKSDDKYSVRYDEMETYLFDGRFKNQDITYISVTRPINMYCSGDECDSIANSGNTKNASVRNTFKWLRREQYARTTKPSIDSSKLSESTKEYNINISDYNSVNVGDNIEYTLLLQNNSYKYYCTGPSSSGYNTKDTCTANSNRTWERLGNSKSYSNLVVTAYVPDNTTYVKCNYDCTKNGNKITWKVPTLENGKYVSIRYTVRVDSGSKITNGGMQVSQGNKTITMGQLTTKVNPTLNKINAEQMRKTLVEFKNAISKTNPGIKYGSTSTTYKVKPSEATDSTFSPYGFVKNIYYNAYGIELGDLSGSNIKNAIFNKDTQYDSFVKKTETEIKALTNKAYKNINNMLVKGFYGGRYLKGNDNGDRTGRLRITDLEFGDIIAVFSESSGKIAGTSSLYIYLGNSNIDADATSAENDKKGTFVRFSSGNKLTFYNSSSDKTAYVFFNELWSKDLFVVLRPSQLYGTTIKYSGGTILGKSNSVEYATYKNLKDLTSSKNYTVKLEYNKTDYKCDGCKTSYSGGNTFGGWYSDAKYSNQIKNGSKLANTLNHTVYSKWIKETFKLPKATVTGYSIEGWYTNSDLTKKAGEVNTDYKIASNVTLYAKWKANSYNVKYNANGGSGTMSNSTHVYDTTSSLNMNKFTKSGYVFSGWSTSKDGAVQYKDGAGVKNLTNKDNGTVNLYAIWRVKEKDEFNVKISVKNGTADALLKTVKKGQSVTFSFTPNLGYSNAKLTCETGELNNNILIIKNITKDLSCSVNFSGIKYNVVYNANGGTGKMNSTVHTYGISKLLSENTFTRVGYNFKGWSTSKNGKIKFKDNENVINLTTNNNINLYAVWNVQSYKISYNLNGGVLENKITSYRITSNDIKLDIPKKEGYRFKGWSINNESEIVRDVIIRKGSTGNKVFTAHYELGKYKVIYKSDKYGKITGITEETLEYKKSPSGTTKIINSGYKDLKWAIDKDVKLKNGTVILSGSPISEKQIKEIVVSDDLVITAYHYAKKFKVTYKDSANGDVSGIDSEEVSYSSNPLGTKIKADRGYKFKTWVANKNVKLKNGKTVKKGNSISDLKSIIVNENIELTPVFETGTFNISYQSDEYGIISGKENENKSYPNVISSTEVSSINENFELSYWTANTDIYLNNDKKINKGDPITNEEVNFIVADTDMILTAHHKQALFNIYYSSYEDIVIVDNIKETVGNPNDIKGPVIEDNSGEEVVFVSDSDIILNTGKTIKAGKAISLEELKNIKLTKDLKLTPRYKKDIISFDKNIIYIIVSLLLGIGLFMFIIKLIKNRNNKNNRNNNSHPDNFGGFTKKKKFSLYRDYYN